MKKITILFAMLLLFAVGTTRAAEEVVTICASSSAWTDYGTWTAQTSDSWGTTWQSSNGKVSFTSSPSKTGWIQKNVVPNVMASSGCVYTLSVLKEGYTITGYSITFKGQNGNSTFTPASGNAVVSDGSSFATLAITGLSTESTAITVTDNWAAISDFTVTLESTPLVDILEELDTKVSENLYNLQSLYGVTGSDKIYSESSDSEEGNIPALIDNNYGTFHHSDWHNSAATPHWVTYELPEASESLRLYIYQRSSSNGNKTGQPYNVTVSGSNDNSTFTEVSTVNLAWSTSYPDLYSQAFTATDSYKYWRITVNSSYHSNGLTDLTNNSWFCAAELYALPNNDKVNPLFDAEIQLRAGITDEATAQALLDNVNAAIANLPTVTYIVKDENGNPLFTSDPVTVAKGTTITTLPEEFQRSAFYTYNNVNVTISESGNTDAVFTATLKEDAPVNFTADTTDPIYYNLNIRSSYLVYNTSATGEVTLQETSEPFNPNASWAFIGNPYDGFKVINKTKTPDYNLTYTSVVTARHSNNNIQFVAAADAAQKLWIIENNTNGFVLRMKENTSIYFHHDSQGNFLRTCSSVEFSAVHNDAGSTIVKSSDDEALEAIYNSMKDMEFGEHLGQYSLAEGKTSEDAQNLIAAVGQDVDSKNTGKYAEDYEALKALNAVLNMPKDGQFLRIKATVGEKHYLQAANAEGTMTFSENTDGASPIFCYYNGKLLAYQNGVAVKNMNQMSAIGGESSDINFKAGIDGSTSTYSLYTMINSYEYYLKSTGVNGENADKNPVNNIEENPKNTFTLEEVTELPITLKAVGDKYYATFSAPVDIASITGATMTMNDVEVSSDNKTVTPKEMDATKGLKANNGVLLIAETNDEVVATIGVADESATTTMKSQIISEPAADHNSAGHYFLGTKSGQIGFYMLKSDGGKTGGFKAYIEKNTSGEAKEGFDLVFGNVTGVETIENGTVQNGEMYNLQGQRVNKAQKGVFIQNGKKVVLK